MVDVIFGRGAIRGLRFHATIRRQTVSSLDPPRIPVSAIKSLPLPKTLSMGQKEIPVPTVSQDMPP